VVVYNVAVYGVRRQRSAAKQGQSRQRIIRVGPGIKTGVPATFLTKTIKKKWISRIVPKKKDYFNQYENCI
jgi:hypothetical protein